MGVRLHQGGADVSLVARGPHLAANNILYVSHISFYRFMRPRATILQ
jgi:hypothetical protein